MNRNLLVIALLLGCASPDDKAIVSEVEKSTKSQEQFFETPVRVKAMTSEIMEDDTVFKTIDNIRYTLFPQGKITLENVNSKRTDTIQLETDLFIEEAHFLHYGKSLIVFYVDTDFDAGASFVECFDTRTTEREWKNDMHGFNLMQPLISDSVAYVASIGFVGKLNLNNGKYNWKHDELYDTTRIEAFDTVYIDNGKVSFIEWVWYKESRKPGSIIVDDNTGTIEEIINTRPNTR